MAVRNTVVIMNRLSHTSVSEVPVRTRTWCTVAMVVWAMFWCLAQVSFAAAPLLRAPQGARYVWMMAATLLAFAFPLLLLWRDRYPQAVFWCCLAVVAVFPYDPMLMLMALSALLARRASRSNDIIIITAAAAGALWAQLRDALQPADASLWHMVFARPGTGQHGVPVELLTGETTVVITAAVTAIVETVIAALAGLHIRSRARLRTAAAQVDAAATQVASLQQDLNSQQLADAIAAEAHDTLAHSLSLLALNASALQAQASELGDTPQARDLAVKAEDIRRQAAGALDEAHAIIDMLRHPAAARAQLIPSADTELTRQALDGLISEARAAGMKLDTWIDIRQLDSLDPAIAKTAYRVIQEGLTNARRHAPGAPLALEVTASPSRGVHVHLSNPITASPAPVAPDTINPAAAGPVSAGITGPEPGSSSADSSEIDAAHTGHRRSGTGLPGLVTRVQSVGGDCRYGVDEHHTFHVDVAIPWRMNSTFTAPRQNRTIAV